jgi:NOL1/NOP2/fmu family ribosome biogenesis protein
MAKENKLSVGMETALKMLKESENGLTIAEMKELGFKNANSSHLTALKRKGLVDSVEVEIEVQTVVKRKVQKYFIPKSE